MASTGNTPIQSMDKVDRDHDEITISHENVMLEAANTSFQIHFQVAPREFARLYNLAQVATAPVLAAAVNRAAGATE